MKTIPTNQSKNKQGRINILPVIRSRKTILSKRYRVISSNPKKKNILAKLALDNWRTMILVQKSGSKIS